MNIQDIIGPVDVYSAAVAIGFGLAITVITTTALARTPKRQREINFDLERLRLANTDAANARSFDVDREVKLGQIAANKQIEVARIESGMVDLKANRGDG